ncbi:MAG TPA: hypothetical protein VF529_03685 [Solirubrobacteraceae bacterium]|jgi:hypothetical protein
MRTETRTGQLARQINLFVVAVTGSRTFKDVIDRGAKKQWIEAVVVRLLGSDDKIRHEVVLQIDWEDHMVALQRSDRGVIAERRFDPETGWLGRACAELATDLNEIAEQGRLSSEWVVLFTSAAGRDVAEVREELGLSAPVPRDWAPGVVQTLFGPYSELDLHELSISWRGVLPEEG